MTARRGRPDHLGEAGRREGAQGTDVELLVDHIGPRHRIALDRPGTALAGEVDGGFHQRTTDSAPPEPGSSEHARERPDGVVGLVLAASPQPWNAVVAQQARVGGARLDGAPADRFAVEVGHEATGGVRAGVPTVRLLPQPKGALLDRKRGEGLPRRQLVPLALTPEPRASRPEHRLQVVATGFVCRYDRHLSISVGHAASMQRRRSPLQSPGRRILGVSCHRPRVGAAHLTRKERKCAH